MAKKDWKRIRFSNGSFGSLTGKVRFKHKKIDAVASVVPVSEGFEEFWGFQVGDIFFSDSLVDLQIVKTHEEALQLLLKYLQQH